MDTIEFRIPVFEEYDDNEMEKKMKVIDVTRPLFPNMTVWPGDESVILERVSGISEGSVANVSRIHAGVHSGTHIDAPLHFIDDGKSVEQLDVRLFTGTAVIIDVQKIDKVTPDSLRDIPIQPGDAVFFKTSYSERSLHEPFDTEYTGITPDTAVFLLNNGVRVVGTDALSIESYYSRDFLVHKTLLGNEALIIEGLMLKNISPGRYRYACLPLCITGADGAPTRVLLFADESM